MASSGDKNPGRVAAGLKAAVRNPNVSEEAKERAVDRLESMGVSEDVSGTPPDYSPTDPDANRVLGGYKATLHNDRTSAQAKEHAREVLESAGYSVEGDPELTEDEHEKRVLAGYKAALHNPRVSAEGKQHAREYLQEYDAL